MSILLRLKYEDRPPEVVELHRFPAYLGRAEKNDVVIQHPTVSSRHAVLERSGRSFVLQDLSSSNGIWLKGKKEKSFRLTDKMEFQLGDLLIEAVFDEEAGHTKLLEVPAGPRWQRWTDKIRGEYAPWLALSLAIFLLEGIVHWMRGNALGESLFLSLMLNLAFTLPLASGFSLFASPVPRPKVIAASVVRLFPMTQLIFLSGKVHEILGYYFESGVTWAVIYSLATGALALYGVQSAFFFARIAKQTALTVGTVLILLAIVTTLLPALPSNYQVTGFLERAPIYAPMESGPSRFNTTGDFLEKIDESSQRLDRLRVNVRVRRATP